MTSSEQIRALIEAAAKATPAPWTRIDAKIYGADGKLVARAWHDRDAVERGANAQLIWAARNSIPALQSLLADRSPTLPLLKELEGLLAEWEAETDTELCSVSEMCKILGGELRALIERNTKEQRK